MSSAIDARRARVQKHLRKAIRVLREGESDAPPTDPKQCNTVLAKLGSAWLDISQLVASELGIAVHGDEVAVIPRDTLLQTIQDPATRRRMKDEEVTTSFPDDDDDDAAEEESASVHCNVANDAIPTEEWVKIEQRCRPGEFCAAGMIGATEGLKEVLAADMKLLEALGVTYEQLGTALETVWRTHVPEFRVEVLGSYLGAQQCPFQNPAVDMAYHGYNYGSEDVVLINEISDERIEFNTLLPHMIACHGFFESNPRYRVDPNKLFQVLGGTKELILTYAAIDKNQYGKRPRLVSNDCH